MKKYSQYKSVSKIKRQNIGKRPTRFGIILDLLADRHKELLMKYKFIKDLSDDDRCLKIIFDIEDRIAFRPPYKDKVYVDPKTKEIMHTLDMRRSLKTVPWNCAYCKKDIESSMEDFDSSNFTCKKCYNYHIKDSKVISKVIAENAYKFTQHCKKLLQEDREKFIQYLKASRIPPCSRKVKHTIKSFNSQI